MPAAVSCRTEQTQIARMLPLPPPAEAPCWPEHRPGAATPKRHVALGEEANGWPTQTSADLADLAAAGELETVGSKESEDFTRQASG